MEICSANPWVNEILVITVLQSHLSVLVFNRILNNSADELTQPVLSATLLPLHPGTAAAQPFMFKAEECLHSPDDTEST